MLEGCNVREASGVYGMLAEVDGEWSPSERVSNPERFLYFRLCLILGFGAGIRFPEAV